MLRKVLLLNPPGNRLYLRDQYCSSVSKANYYWPPIDLLVLSGILYESYDVEAIDAIVSGLSYQSCFNEIIKSDIDIVIFLTGASSWKDDFEFMKRIKEKKKIITIATGGCLLHNGTKVMEENIWLDAILLDFTTRNVLDYLDSSNGSNKIDNVIFRVKNAALVGDKTTQDAQFEIPIPRHEIFLLKKYRLPHIRRHPFTSVITSFGCPFSCPFCIAGKIAFKSRKVSNTIEELEYLLCLGVKEIFFKDFTFEANRKNCEELCQRMIKSNLDLSWICASRVDTVDEELLRLMKRAGCHTIQLGVESGSEEILKRYKNIIKEQVKSAFELCKKLNIRTLAHFIIGLPGEDTNSILEAVDFAKELNCDYASFNIATPYVGTELRDEAVKNGWISSDIDILDPSCSYPTMETDRLSKEEIWKLRNLAIKEFYLRPSYLFKRALGIRSFYECEAIVKEGISLIKNLDIKGRCDD